MNKSALLLVPNLSGCCLGLWVDRGLQRETPIGLQVSRSCHHGNGFPSLTFLCLFSPGMLTIVFIISITFSIIELYFTF